MLHDTSPLAVLIFAAFVVGVIGLSFWLGRKKQSAAAYYAAHGEVHWFVNGIAFAGDYLSAASFLGICGMIAFRVTTASSTRSAFWPAGWWPCS